MTIKTFEADLLATFLVNKKTFIKISKKLKPEHINNENFRWMYEVMLAYFNKHKGIPTISVFKNELLKTTKQSEEKKLIYASIKKLYKRKVKTPISYIESNIDDKIYKKEFLESIYKALDEIEKGDFDTVRKKLLKDIILNRFDEGTESPEIRLLKDWKLRQIMRKKVRDFPDPKRFVPTPYSAINRETHGIQFSEAATVAGITTIGKSIIAGEFGVSAFINGMNTLHFTIENTGEQTAQRYDSRISRIKYDTLKFYSFSKNELVAFSKIFEALESSMKNDVVIKETTRKKTDIVYVDKTVNLLELEGFKTEFLIIDSCDIMGASEKYDSYRLDRASVYWDFKDYCKIKRIPGLTTTQLKTPPKKRDEFFPIGSEDLSESYDKARILDIIFIIDQTEEDEKSNLVDFFVSKNRDGKSGAKIKLFKDSAKMAFREVIQ